MIVMVVYENVISRVHEVHLIFAENIDSLKVIFRIFLPRANKREFIESRKKGHEEIKR